LIDFCLLTSASRAEIAQVILTQILRSNGGDTLDEYLPVKHTKWIAYVGPFKYGRSNAAAHRVHGVARSLTNIGYDVVIGSGDSEPVEPTLLETGEDQGNLYHIGLGEVPPPGASVLTKVGTWFVTLGTRTVQWLERQNTKPSHVIVYTPHAAFVSRLLQWCRRNNVAMIVDVVEWYDSWHVQGGPLGPFNISTKFAMRVLNSQSDGIIAISSYLVDYYKGRGCKVTRVPPTLDVKNAEFSASVGQRLDYAIKLAYAGTPGKKDLLDHMLEALLALDPEGRQLRLAVAGPNPTDVLALPALRSRGFSSVPPCVEVLGYLPQGQALDLVRMAHFLPLLRPGKRYAQAGFPTKVVESLTVGTPVICNLTSDLGLYIHDGAEGLVCQDHSVRAFSEALERALRLTDGDYRQMRQSARARAERSFDYRLFGGPLSDFLEETRR